MSQLNVGNIDRALRIAAGLILIGLAGYGTIGAWGFIGIIPLLTGVVAMCPLYRLLGLATTSR
jgi:fatty acid desaturase